jgi:DDE superfamily endonuclease
LNIANSTMDICYDEGEGEGEEEPLLSDERPNEHLTAQLLLLSSLCMEEEDDEGETREQNTWNPSIAVQRLHWKQYWKRHVTRGTFKRRLRMKKESFDLLLSYIYKWLLVNEQMANLQGGTIILELCLYCTLRWLAGGSYLDISDVAGISKASFYRVVWKTITAIVCCDEMQIKWPSTAEEIQKGIAGFSSISYEQAICNCVGVLDGFLVRIKVPTKKEAANVRVFFSGHYQCYGVNCQAATDHLSQFIYFAVAAPGVSKDRDAVKHCGLKNLIEKLRKGVCVIADAAYELTEHMVPVYQGVDKLKPRHDNFNFYASQVQIRAEMAFGMMTNKWGILQRAIGVSLKNIKWLMQAQRAYPTSWSWDKPRCRTICLLV